MNVPTNLKYTNDHEWLLVEGSTGTIGITEFAQGELGDVVFVDIDPNIKELVRGNNFGTIEAVKTVGELIAPVSGSVIELNAKLADVPETINVDPYGEGWMIKVELSNLSELDELLDSDSYLALIS